MTPTTPVRPIPDTTSSHPNAVELLGDRGGGAVDLVEQLRMGMHVVPPGGDLGMQVGNTIDDGHRNGSLERRARPAPPPPPLPLRPEQNPHLRARVKAGNRAPPIPAGPAAGSGMGRADRHPVRSRHAGRGDHVRVHAFAIDRSRPRFYTRPCEPVAQMVEHLTFNQVVLGSSPSGLTNHINDLM